MFEGCCLVEELCWPISPEHLLWLTLFDPWFGSEFICTCKGQGVVGGEKLSEGTVHVQRCQISAPVAGHLAMPLTERKVQWIMAETPLLRAKSGWGAEEAYHNQSE